MKSVLIVVDYQYDFVAEDGLLTAGAFAQDIEDEVFNIADSYIKEEKDVIFTLDTHQKMDWDKHPESKSFCLHCEKGSKGQEPYGKLNNLKDKVTIIEKRGYCIDFDKIQDIVDTYDEVTLCGVVTDICVLQTAIGLYNGYANNGKKVTFKLKKSACASFDKAMNTFAIDYMQNILGFEII